MGMTRLRRVLALAVVAVALAGCGGDSDDDAVVASDEPTADTDDTGDAATDDDGDESEEPAAEADEPADEAEEPEEASSSGGVGGTLVLGDETITLDSARCFLEEQDAAAGGGKILFVGQAFGTDSAGDAVALDVSRYNEDSQFVGDDIIIDIGDFDTGSSWQVTADLGTVQLDGRTLRADGLTLTNWDDFSEASGSFEFSC